MDGARFETLTRCFSTPETRRQALGAALGGSLAALGLRETAGKKKKQKEPTYTTVTRTVRQPLTQTFTNTGAIAIPASGIFAGNAGPYPSLIEVSGFANGVITDLNLTLHRFGHTNPDDVNVLLAATHLPGQNAIVMSDVGGDADVVNLTLTFDDQAAAVPSDNGLLVSGTFQPTNAEGAEGPVDPFPGANPTGNAALSVFNGGNPNGTWQLFVVDDNQNQSGQIAGGWSLQITAAVDVQIQEQVEVPPKKKKKKKHKK